MTDQVRTHNNIGFWDRLFYPVSRRYDLAVREAWLTLEGIKNVNILDANRVSRVAQSV
jgi:hypothetical protein